ncbi:MAG TPA: CinA family nicotinamide mononucleotide deamidase-related protein [Candidatus Limnocylindria bacterium]|nr:CinA family nicotinamide mononucleotide deamidase-related protein [Candidatus Limnocylindria bacterium]
MRAEILSIGTELLLGQILDTNAQYLAQRLAALGIDLLYISTVGDNLTRCRQTIERAFGRSDLIVCTGGLGPTEDDLTREAIAATVGEEPAVDPGLERELREWFGGRGLQMPERNRKQAWLIPSARAIPNPNGTAPGWDVRKDGKRIVAMPGVPREMTDMWERHIEPTLVAGAVLRWRTLKMLGIGESAVEEALAELVRSTAPTVATYAKNDGVHVRITDKAPDAAAADARIATMERTIRERLGRYVWGTDDDTLGSVIGRSLDARGWRLATAESLSAGDVARTLSDTPGAESWFARGLVLPHAGGDALERAIATDAPVRLVVPYGESASEIAVTTPDGRSPVAVRFGSPAEGRRRAHLAALDLLRRVLSSPGA